MRATKRSVLALGLVACAASSAATEPAHDQVQIGVMLLQAAGYFGRYSPFSDGKFDSNGVVTNVIGIHAGYSRKLTRWLEVSPRLDLMYIWFRNDAYLPDSLTDARGSVSISGVVPIGNSELTAGGDIGYVASGLHSSGEHAFAGGGSAALVVQLRNPAWAPFGWFVDISAGVASPDGDDYAADMTWLGRLSVGMTYGR